MIFTSFTRVPEPAISNDSTKFPPWVARTSCAPESTYLMRRRARGRAVAGLRTSSRNQTRPCSSVRIGSMSLIEAIAGEIEQAALAREAA